MNDIDIDHDQENLNKENGDEEKKNRGGDVSINDVHESEVDGDEQQQNPTALQDGDTVTIIPNLRPMSKK